MALYARGRREKREQDLGICNCIVAIFQVMIACQSITFISGQGHLYSDSEFQSRKLLQDVSLFPKQQAQGVTSEPHEKNFNSVSHTTPQIRIIRFEPPFLDFDTECVGMPKLRTVFIHNPNKERDLQLSSISARTSHFHASFFDKKIVPPGGNTSFEVVFLARVVGNVENTLFINTLHGTFPYQVFGIGVPNPYRLRPYLGAKVPINSSFSPLISMHNPTSEPLQVTEMYSSSGYLQLQLPRGQHEGDKEQWEIPPYETREVIRARFMGQVEANHTAFIRIKTSQAQDSSQDFHILPVEVEVSSDPGIYSALELLDFGTLRTHYDEPKTLPLFLLNSGEQEVQISSISLVTPNPAVEIRFKSMKLKPSENIFTLVANVTFSANLAEPPGNQKGTIIVKARDKNVQPLEIPLIANLLDGTLAYDLKAVLFHLNETRVRKNVRLSNLFKFPIVLQNFSLTDEASSNFKVFNFSGPVLLPVSSRISPFSIEYDPTDPLASKGSENAEEGLLYYLTLHTNISKFFLPLHSYSGLISYKVLREDKEKLDFGIMGTLDKRQVLFALYNHNPAKILLEKINSTLKNIQIRLVSLTQDSDKNLTQEIDFQLENFWLPSNSCSVFEVTLSASEKEEDIISSIKIVTKYQEIAIPVFGRIVVGTLTVKPEKIKFQRSFPGLVVHQALTVVNTFAQSTKLEYVHSKEIDKRFYYKKLKNQGLTLEPNKKTKIGKVYFDARQSCKPDRCYTGLPTSTTIGHHWLTTLALGPDSVEFDAKRYKEHRQRWKNLQTKGLAGPNMSLVLSADVGNVEVPVHASLYWPSLLEEDKFNFPLTHVGRKSVACLKIVNPSDMPVVVQVLPLSLYPHPETVLNTLGMTDRLNDPTFITNNSTLFHLFVPRQDTKDSMTSQMVWLEYTLNGKLNHTVVNLFLDPGDRVNLRVEFVPYDDNPKSTVILLRNNLTIIDVLPMHGRGAYEHLTLGGKAPNLQTSVLRFKLTKDLLKDCTRKKPNPSFTVRKWFHANNTGMLPIHITSMTVSGSPCDGYGFRVLDCDQFILRPNTSKKIEIAYTPDFTSYLVLHELKLVTAQGNEMIFTLNVSLPPYMLPLCQEAVPRPSWEPTLYYFIVAVMLVLFVGVMLMAYLESITVWEAFAHICELEHHHKIGRRKVQAPEGFGKTFDLKNISSSYMGHPSSSPILKAEAIHNGEAPFSGKKFSTVTLKPSFKFVGHLESDDVKHDSSQQTDPHPDFPPLTSSIFSSYPTGLFSRILSFFKRKNKPVVSVETESQPIEQVPTTPVQNHVQNNHAGPRLRSNASVNNEKRRNDRKFKSLENFHQSRSTESHSKPTAEIHPVAKPTRIQSRKNSGCTTPETNVKDIGNTVFNEPDLKDKDGPKVRRSESEESVNQNMARKKALQRRRSRSKSTSQCSRESTSSSGSLDLPDNDVQQSRISVDAVETKTKVAEPEVKSVTAKPVHGKKLRKLSRKQAKALAREKEAQEKENVEKEEPEKPATPSDEEKPVFESRKAANKKLTRQPKRRSLSPSGERTPVKPEKKKLEKSISEEKYPRNPTPPRNKIETKPSPKRRSYSYNADDNKQKEKLNKITIYKRPNGSHSSSSQEISESSSGEGTALWEIPAQGGDVDEDMRQLSKQSQQAEVFIGQKQGKDRKRGKGASSPVQLSSGSRSSSFSSIMSTASSNDGVPTKAQNNGGSITGTPSKKLLRSMSDATGNQNSSRTQLRRRSPYPPIDPTNVSPTHSSRKDKSSTRTSSPQQHAQYLAPARTTSSPSVLNNAFNGKQQNPTSNSQWLYDNQFTTSSYSAFGKSNFNLAENLIGKTTTAQSSVATTWESPFSDNSSLYSTPSPTRPRNASPPSSLSMRPLGWNNPNTSPVQTTGYPTFDAPPGTPTTPGPRAPPGLGWGEPAVPATTTNMTTHSIWSVSNAVTMDENRNTECDPLGVRSIWSNTRQLQNPNWHDMR